MSCDICGKKVDSNWLSKIINRCPTCTVRLVKEIDMEVKNVRINEVIDFVNDPENGINRYTKEILRAMLEGLKNDT